MVDQSEQNEQPRGRSGGINVEAVQGEIRPPRFDEEIAEGFSAPAREDAAAKIQRAAAVPMSAALIKGPLRFEGNFLNEMTGFSGWMWTDEELDEVGKVFEQCMFSANPMVQCLLLVTTMHCAKGFAYIQYRRAQQGKQSSPDAYVGERKS